MNLAATGCAAGAQPSQAGAGSGQSVTAVTGRNGERSARGDQGDGSSGSQSFDAVLGAATEATEMQPTTTSAGAAGKALPDSATQRGERPASAPASVPSEASGGDALASLQASAKQDSPAPNPPAMSLPNAAVGGSAAAFRKAIAAREVQASLVDDRGDARDSSTATVAVSDMPDADGGSADPGRQSEAAAPVPVGAGTSGPSIAALVSLLAASSGAAAVAVPTAPIPAERSASGAQDTLRVSSPAIEKATLPGSVPAGTDAPADGGGMPGGEARLVMVEVVGRETHLAPVASAQRGFAQAASQNTKGEAASVAGAAAVQSAQPTTAASGSSRPVIEPVAGVAGSSTDNVQLQSPQPQSPQPQSPQPQSPQPQSLLHQSPQSQAEDVAPAERVAHAGETPPRADNDGTVSAQIAGRVTAAARDLVANRGDTASTSAPQSPLPAGTPQASKDFAGPARTLILGLRPDDLGRVVVRLHLSGGSLRVSVAAESASAQARLREERDALRDSLRAQGLTIEALTVESTQSVGAASQPAGDNPDGSMPGSTGFAGSDPRGGASADASAFTGGGSREPAGEGRGARRASGGADVSGADAARNDSAADQSAPKGSVYL